MILNGLINPTNLVEEIKAKPRLEVNYNIINNKEFTILSESINLNTANLTRITKEELLKYDCISLKENTENTIVYLLNRTKLRR